MRPGNIHPCRPHATVGAAHFLLGSVRGGMSKCTGLTVELTPSGTV